MAEPFHILVVEDEPDVRATFREWLRAGVANLNLLEASNAPEALEIASSHPVDLAVLDWNLGAGIDGLQVLKSLTLFHSDIVAILVTGHADLATPLQALKLGVRDYLDKHAGLDKTAFLQAVNRQLERIAPLKREKAFHASLVRFRDILAQALPLVQQAGALRPEATDHPALALAGLLARAIPHQSGALVSLAHDGTAVGISLSGESVASQAGDGRRSLAAQALATGAPMVLTHAMDLASDPTLIPLPLELNHESILVIPLGNRHALELFGTKTGGFGPDAEALARLARPVGLALENAGAATADALSQLSAAVASAMESAGGEPRQPSVITKVRDDLESSWREVMPPGAGEAGLRAARALAELARRHGITALEHVEKLIAATGELMDRAAGERG